MRDSWLGQRHRQLSRDRNRERIIQSFNRNTIFNSSACVFSSGYFLSGISIKALANEDTLLRTHCCRHKCFPVCLRTQHLLRTQKMFLILFRNILCLQQMFPSLRSPRNIMGNNVSTAMCPRLSGPLDHINYVVLFSICRQIVSIVFNR